ncbi:MAG: Nucleotidyl transferase [Clostridia bacterium]|nr:Nucleotidyl transferase [Clostridia bacterium]
MKSNIKAVIMAGGIGSRLKPITMDIPKPLAPVAGKPCIKYIMELLKKYEINKICATLMYRGQDIKNTLSDISDMEIHYFEETVPLGTAGSVKNCKSFLDSDFLVISGDCLCDFDLSAAVDFHYSHGGLVTIVLTRVQSPLEYGIAVLDDKNIITRFIEKPSWNRVYSDTVNTGIYIFSREILNYIDIENSKQVDFSKDVFPLLLKENIPIHGYTASGYWCDIGSIDAYLRSNYDFLDGKVNINKDIKNEKAEIGICNNTVTDQNGITIFPPVYIGKNVIAKGAIIGPYAVIGDNCVLEQGARVERSVLFSGVKMQKNSSIRGSILCSNSVLHDGASCGEQSVIGSNTVIGQNTIIAAGSKIYPKNKISDNTFINGNVFNGYKEFILDNNEITREVGNDLDISKFIRAGAALGSVLKGDIAVGREGEDTRALALSVSAGIIAVSSSVFDLGECEINALRYVVKKYGFKGGIFVKQENSNITMRFFLSDGLYLTREKERAFEQAFNYSEFKYGLNGAFRPFKGFMRTYENLLKELLGQLKPINALVIGTTALLDKVTVKGSDKTMEHIYIKDDEVYIEKPAVSIKQKSVAYDPDLVKCVMAFVYGKTFGSVIIPYEYPFVIDNIGEANGFKVRRLTLEDPDRALLYEMSDPNIQTAVLLRYMSQNNCTFGAIAEKLPKFVSRHRDIDTLRGKSEVMHELVTGLSEGRELVEGVKFYDNKNKGNILIIPMKNSNSFRISAEAFDAEAADEICDFYVKKIRKNIIDK